MEMLYIYNRFPRPKSYRRTFEKQASTRVTSVSQIDSFRSANQKEADFLGISENLLRKDLHLRLFTYNKARSYLLTVSLFSIYSLHFRAKEPSILIRQAWNQGRRKFFNFILVYLRKLLIPRDAVETLICFFVIVRKWVLFAFLWCYTKYCVVKTCDEHEINKSPRKSSYCCKLCTKNREGSRLASLVTRKNLSDRRMIRRVSSIKGPVSWLHLRQP